MRRFDGKVAAITGGLGDIGRAIGARLAAEGASVILADIRSVLDASAIAAAERTFMLPLDVADEGSWAGFMCEVQSRWGHLDVLVNNAGIQPDGRYPFDGIPLQQWRQVMSVNLDGVMLGTRAAIALMKTRRSGAIVNIASIAGYLGSVEGGIYGTSKGAVRSLTRHAALSCARHGIRVNGINPGFIWTDMVRDRSISLYGTEKDAIEALKAMNPLQRMVEAKDVAAAVAFLASNDAASITGAEIVIDGGRLTNA